MQATGIIAEYNPFHNGHLYHIQETKRLTQQPVIVVMSGSFMQRATLVDPTPAGETLLGQRVFIVQKPAPTPDAAGGTRALAAAARQVAVEVDEWVGAAVR